MPKKVEPQEEFVHFVAAYRLKVGWTQKRLAKELATTEMTVSRWETGETRVDMATLQAVAEALREPLDDDLLAGEDLLHPPEMVTANQLLRKLPKDDQKLIMKQLKAQVKQLADEQ